MYVTVFYLYLSSVIWFQTDFLSKTLVLYKLYILDKNIMPQGLLLITF